LLKTVPPLFAAAGFLTLLLLLLLAAEVLHRRFHWRTEQSRKFIHITGGIVCLFLPSFFDSHWWVLAVTGIAFLLLLITYIKKTFAATHQTKRSTIGSVLFPVPVYGCFLAATCYDSFLYFYLPVSLLTVADTMAEVAGTQWGHKSRSFFDGQKTLAGAIGFFLTALPVCVCWLYVYNISWNYALPAALLISFFAAAIELVSLRGWDNLSVPVTVILLLKLLTG